MFWLPPRALGLIATGAGDGDSRPALFNALPSNSAPPLPVGGSSEWRRDRIIASLPASAMLNEHATMDFLTDSNDDEDIEMHGADFY